MSSSFWMFWGLIVLVAAASSIATFAIIYFVWLRSMTRKLFVMQRALVDLAAFFQKKAEANSQEEGESKTREMLVEGKIIEIVEIDGREIVRFGEELTAGERSRILAYLKEEGFIS